MGEVRASRPVNSLPRDVAAPETRVNSHTISAVVNVLEIAAVAVAALVPTAVVPRAAALETAEAVVTLVPSERIAVVEIVVALGIIFRHPVHYLEAGQARSQVEGSVEAATTIRSACHVVELIAFLWTTLVPAITWTLERPTF